MPPQSPPTPDLPRRHRVLPHHVILVGGDLAHLEIARAHLVGRNRTGDEGADQSDQPAECEHGQVALDVAIGSNISPLSTTSRLHRDIIPPPRAERVSGAPRLPTANAAAFAGARRSTPRENVEEQCDLGLIPSPDGQPARPSPSHRGFAPLGTLRVQGHFPNVRNL